VATWNVWWRFAGWRERGDAILATLRDVGADVLALQEVWSTPEGTFADALAGRLGLHVAWVPTPVPARWNARAAEAPEVGAGLAVLSRWPVAAVEPLALPGGEMGAVFALVAHPAGPIPVFCVHLHADPAGSAMRCRQVAWLAQRVAERDAGPQPALVLGDLNAEPDSDELRLLCGAKTAPPVPGQVLLDAWLLAADGADGATWSRANPHVAATPYPSARVDHVLVALRPDGAARVLTARRFGDRPVDGVWPSDHFGVLADLALEPRAPADRAPKAVTAEAGVSSERVNPASRSPR
jgi:endonuclease/exonuclease/phosphatase family metal-dependent hydrolase